AKAQEPTGSRFTRRISPGYRDFPLAAQAVFAELAGAATGIVCGAGMGLSPRKSLTALLGLLP
ncbi:MAG: methionine synthase, partial [Acidobacteriota bacterium]